MKEIQRDSNARESNKQQQKKLLLAEVTEADATRINGGCHRYGYGYGYSGYRSVAYSRPRYNYRPLYL